MKKTLVPLSRSGGRSRTGRWFQNALATAALLGSVALSQAQISISLGVNPTETFTATPPAASWATYTNGTGGVDGGGTYTTPADLDTVANTINQSLISEPLPTIAAVGTSRYARHNTAAGNVFTQPTQVGAASLKATLQNNSGGDINVLQISYAYGIAVAPVTDSCPGQRVYWSLSGTPGTWQNIGSLSGVTTAGTISANVAVGTWPNGTPLYLLWLDDNNLTGADGSFNIDNVVFTTSISSPISITNNPASTTVAERAPATFTVAASGSPQSFYWQSNGVFIPGANSASYTIPAAPFSASGRVFRCMVSNAFNSPFSAGATLTVNADTNAPVAVVANASTNGTDITITFSEAMNPAYADTGAFLVYVTGTDFTAGEPPTGAVVNGNTITLTMNAALTDGVNYSVYIADVYDTSLGVADPGNVIVPNPTFIPIRRSLLLLDFNGPNNVWRFSLETNLFDTGWETIGYNDSTWTNGPTGIGRDASANGVPIVSPAYPIADSSPTFLRRNFFLPSSTVGVTLSIRHVFEDGAVVYINGVEAGRFNAPTGTLSVVSRAPVGAAEPCLISASLPLSTAGLVAGDNLIAVVVLQNGPTSSDMEFALELTATINTYAAGPPSIVTQPSNVTVSEGGSASFSVVADGALPLTYQWSRNGTALVGATNATLNLTAILPAQAGNYRVGVTNSLGGTNSTVAVLTVNADLINPVFVSATGPTNADTVVATFYDFGGFNLADLQNPAKYSLGLTAGGGNLAISTAVAVASGTNMVVTLTTAPRVANQNYTLTTTLRDRSAALNPVTPASLPVVQTVILFGFNHVWRYDQSGNDLGAAWSGVGFNDSGWLSGAGFLAFENSLAPLTLFTNLAGGNGTNTSLNLTNATVAGIGGTNITFYFRTTSGALPFNPSTLGNSVHAVSYFDDGGVIYVNGAESMRFNLTNSPTALNYTNLAAAGSTEGAGGLITSNLTGFVQAGNVIAVEVHQNTVNSSDIAWGMQLEASVTTFSAGCPLPHIADNGNGTVTISWTGAATLEETSVLQTPSASTVWTPSARVNGTPFTPSGIRFYRLRCP